MTHSFSFAVTLHRVFDSAPPKTKALFFAGKHRVLPIEKPNGLYVFLHGAENPLTVICDGFMRASINAVQGAITPAVLYPDKFSAAPANCKLVRGNGKANDILYVIDKRYEPKLVEHNAAQGRVRVRTRKPFASGCLLFEAENQKEIALILEKQPPDIFYVSKLEQDYTNGALRRVYCTRTNEDGEFYLVVPEEFSCGPTDYLYLGKAAV